MKRINTDAIFTSYVYNPHAYKTVNHAYSHVDPPILVREFSRPDVKMLTSVLAGDLGGGVAL